MMAVDFPDVLLGVLVLFFGFATYNDAAVADNLVCPEGLLPVQVIQMHPVVSVRCVEMPVPESPIDQLNPIPYARNQLIKKFMSSESLPRSLPSFLASPPSLPPETSVECVDDSEEEERSDIGTPVTYLAEDKESQCEDNDDDDSSQSQQILSEVPMARAAEEEEECEDSEE